MSEVQDPNKDAPDAEPIVASLTTLTPVFKLVFLSVLGITILALVTNVSLVIFLDAPTDQAKSLIETCSTILKAGFGAIIGLIGGKSV